MLTLDKLSEFANQTKIIQKEPRLRLDFGALNFDVPHVAPAFGSYAIQLEIHNKGQEYPVAYMGFDVEDTQRKIVITQTPQGRHLDVLPRPGKTCLKNTDFRGDMVKGLINFAQRIGIEEIEGVSAVNHFNIRCGHVPIEKGKQIIDDVLERCGFVPKESGNFVYRISK